MGPPILEDSHFKWPSFWGSRHYDPHGIIPELEPSQLQPAADRHLRRLADIDIHARINEGPRSKADQAVDYAKGRTTKSPLSSPEHIKKCGALGCPVTYAKPGDSPHQWRQGYDIVIFDDDGTVIQNGDHPYHRIAQQFGREENLKAGVDFKPARKMDPPHYELKNWTKDPALEVK
jgi:hypothetical protein